MKNNTRILVGFDHRFDLDFKRRRGRTGQSPVSQRLGLEHRLSSG